jgi:hypothetical protein
MNAIKTVGSWALLFAIGCVGLIAIGAISRFYWEMLLLGWKWGGLPT